MSYRSNPDDGGMVWLLLAAAGFVAWRLYSDSPAASPGTAVPPAVPPVTTVSPAALPVAAVLGPRADVATARAAGYKPVGDGSGLLMLIDPLHPQARAAFLYSDYKPNPVLGQQVQTGLWIQASLDQDFDVMAGRLANGPGGWAAKYGGTFLPV